MANGGALLRFMGALDHYRDENSGMFRLSWNRGFMLGDYVAYRVRKPEEGEADLMLVVEIFSTCRNMQLPTVLRVTPQYDESCFLPMDVIRYEKLRDTEHGYVYIAKLQGLSSQAARELK
jgi:hypothetical protein|uniref:Uncharacterized protein n=1 Tax=Myoviridae sp. ctshb19 TaxID=2825194 RepID=A0A8S5UGQ5_9CAUD|nr:MAG TPA: hypothetical protein [Myoviridae sp. ctshb19]